MYIDEGDIVRDMAVTVAVSCLLSKHTDEGSILNPIHMYDDVCSMAMKSCSSLPT